MAVRTIPPLFRNYLTSWLSITPTILLLTSSSSSTCQALETSSNSRRAMTTDYYRADGVRITHDPYEPGMASKYGTPGQTDSEGFDPYRDTVGAGIYGGVVVRDDAGSIQIGDQYQNHNPRPGPMYRGGGYTPIVQALKRTSERAGIGKEEEPNNALLSLLQQYPDLVNDISTGGAQPLHMCGMSNQNQAATRTLIQHGADIEALDSYGMTPLMRMASNNLPLGARMLLEAGADLENRGGIGETAVDVGKGGRGKEVLAVLKEFATGVRDESGASIVEVRVDGAEVLYAGPNGAASADDAPPSREVTEVNAINGIYKAQNGATLPPASFATVCADSNLGPAETMWKKLNNGAQWYKHTKNDSYIYHNKGDGKWWIDGPSGLGVFIVDVYRGDLAKAAVPAHGWKFLGKDDGNGVRILPPMVRTFRRVDAWEKGV